MIEGVLHHVLTLNYDLAMQNAFTHLGRPDSITFVHGPADHHRIGAHSVIYLHRSVEQDEMTWVLRKGALDEEWQGGWEDAVAGANLSSPLTVFIGLGSPAAVLSDTVSRLASAARSQYYLVDPAEGSHFAQALGPQLTGNIRMFWSDFMSALADRVVVEQSQHLRNAAEKLAASEVGIETENLEHLVDVVGRLGLLELGRARSRWLMGAFEYEAEGDETRQSHVADLLLSGGWLMKALEASNVDVDGQGVVTYGAPGMGSISVTMVHARGLRSWATVESYIRSANAEASPARRIRHVLVEGLRDNTGLDVGNLVRAEDTDDLIRGVDTVSPILTTALRARTFTPEELTRILN